MGPTPNRRATPLGILALFAAAIDGTADRWTSARPEDEPEGLTMEKLKRAQARFEADEVLQFSLTCTSTMTGNRHDEEEAERRRRINAKGIPYPAKNARRRKF